MNTMPQDEMPLYVLATYMAPSMTAVMRLALTGGAVMLGLAAVVIPLVAQGDVQFIAYFLFGFAVLDLLLAAWLPQLLARHQAPLRLRLYRGAVTILLGEKRVIDTIPYDEVSEVAEAGDISDKDRAAGFTGVTLRLRAPRGALQAYPHYYDRTRQILTLKGLRSEDFPAARIKELVEKSRPA